MANIRDKESSSLISPDSITPVNVTYSRSFVNDVGSSFRRSASSGSGFYEIRCSVSEAGSEGLFILGSLFLIFEL